nr:MAG TPA: hypothetical protein [Inoviridae sp.]
MGLSSSVKLQLFMGTIPIPLQPYCYPTFFCY